MTIVLLSFASHHIRPSLLKSGLLPPLKRQGGVYRLSAMLIRSTWQVQAVLFHRLMCSQCEQSDRVGAMNTGGSPYLKGRFKVVDEIHIST